jgi:hypothetical protein
MDVALGNRLIELSRRISAGFTATNWGELGLLTGQSNVIDSHRRLLRSLSWGDEDYDGNVLDVLKMIVTIDPRTLTIIESYVDRHFPGESTYVSAKPAERKITFAPNVFTVPEGHVELDLVAVMMPFAAEFVGVYRAIQYAAKECRLRCLRADDIWEESTIMQDVFNLIFRAQVVVVDFTGKNPNVMYETGIAHTLGKHVVPISQAIGDIPSDIGHHRALPYLRNGEGLAKLSEGLAKKLKQFTVESVSTPKRAAETDYGDIPF